MIPGLHKSRWKFAFAWPPQVERMQHFNPIHANLESKIPGLIMIDAPGLRKERARNGIHSTQLVASSRSVQITSTKNWHIVKLTQDIERPQSTYHPFILRAFIPLQWRAATCGVFTAAAMLLRQDSWTFRKYVAKPSSGPKVWCHVFVQVP